MNIRLTELNARREQEQAAHAHYLSVKFLREGKPTLAAAFQYARAIHSRFARQYVQQLLRGK